MCWRPRCGGYELRVNLLPPGLSRRNLLPRSLAARTALVLLVGLALVQVAGLTIYAFDRMDLLRLAQNRDIAVRAMGLYRSIALSPPERRAAAVRELAPDEEGVTRLEARPPNLALPPASPAVMRQFAADMLLVPVPAADRPRDMLLLGGPNAGVLAIGLRLADGRWLNLLMPMPAPRPWHSINFLVAFLLMTVTAAGLIVWAVRRLTAPVAILAAAAEALGRNVAAPSSGADLLPEGGPAEVAMAAAAFNTMAGRIRRFVQDRTFMLTAIGHDLRTPITRMKLRVEFIEDDVIRGKLLADLDALEAMISATLAFGRDATAQEPVSAVDLPALARTVLDEAGDARPDMAERVGYDGPEHLAVWVRPIALKRALANLVANALNYGGSARVTLTAPQWVEGVAVVRLLVDDEGPGIPEEELDRVFQPFHRVEGSRNSETGGVGLGLPIARNVLRAHGGDVLLANRPGGGARATVILPA